MKSITLALIFFVVGSQAVPSVPFAIGAKQGRIVTGSIIKAIEEFAQSIRDAGLDPYEYTDSYSYQLPVPVLFDMSAFVDMLSFTGLSNIAVNDMSYSILTNRLKFDISLPRVSLAIGGSGSHVVFFGDEYKGSVSGSLNIIQPRIVGNVRVNYGVISGVSIRSLSLQFTLGRIESGLNLNIMNYNISEYINTYLGSTIPAKLLEFRNEINELLEAVAWKFIDENM